MILLRPRISLSQRVILLGIKLTFQILCLVWILIGDPTFNFILVISDVQIWSCRWSWENWGYRTKGHSHLSTLKTARPMYYQLSASIYISLIISSCYRCQHRSLSRCLPWKMGGWYPLVKGQAAARGGLICYLKMFSQPTSTLFRRELVIQCSRSPKTVIYIMCNVNITVNASSEPIASKQLQV